MTETQWAVLHAWLHRVFPADEAAEMYAEHVEEARRAGLALPNA